ncbi:MAG: GNAT family N-acetyltransferase [Thermoplasmata archaeon]|uniref:GNAT family N-acetyltransferase n=1 Tax=Candidatus Sysuiplasma superficiale TaxID=2823368 RepID=A0A8J7YU83_9ARCH|nr:GNAT family N-acetyltransferase [Candidatus Sysuiplasma superficiale]MBX8644774.1 GNAT family N-acetyltransferase [Candidatus Sysuiplasma superficiale]MCL4347018.1 GNAT family N-acetyltransferase [Candidatus Thermoplasmatota archaeon]
MSERRAIKVRRARRSDAGEFARLVKQLALYEKLTPPDASQIDRLIDDGFGRKKKYSLIMAFCEGKAAGYAVYFMTYSTFLAKQTLYLEDLFVDGPYRRQGIGSLLFSELLKIATANGCGRMEWMVLSWNDAAISFYKALGAEQLDGWKTYRLVSDRFREAAKIARSSKPGH